MHLLMALQTLFSLWMLYDAIRRGAAQYWWIIVLVPFGEVAYFFAVVWPELRASGSLGALFQRQPSLEELRRDFRQTPSHDNRLRLAIGLHDHDLHEEALEHLVEVLERTPDDKHALWVHARACLQTGRTQAAVDSLETLLDLDVTYREFQPVFELARTYWEGDFQDEAIARLEIVSRSCHRIAPRVRLAEYLIEAGRSDDARRVLRQGLDSYETSPSAIRRVDRRPAREARTLLRRLPT